MRILIIFILVFYILTTGEETDKLKKEKESTTLQIQNLELDKSLLKIRVEELETDLQIKAIKDEHH